MQEKKDFVAGANNSSTNHTAGSRNEQLSILNFNGSNIAFDKSNGNTMVNATQMAKIFGKKTRDWLITQQADDLMQALTVARNLSTVDLVKIKQGGTNQGTWFHEDLALLFAQWLSPKFYIACNDKLKQLLTQQTLCLPAKYGVYPIVFNGQILYLYTDVLKALGASTKGSSARRKAKHPQHFVKVAGRNAVTGEYFDYLKQYYERKNETIQLELALDFLPKKGEIKNA